jgi:hypothetical protein
VSTVNATDEYTQKNTIHNKPNKKAKPIATHPPPRLLQIDNSTNTNKIASAIQDVTSTLKTEADASLDIKRVQDCNLPLIHQSNNSRRKRKRGEDNNTELKDFRRTYLGIDPALSADERVGESKTQLT